MEPDGGGQNEGAAVGMALGVTTTKGGEPDPDAYCDSSQADDVIHDASYVLASGPDHFPRLRGIPRDQVFAARGRECRWSGDQWMSGTCGHDGVGG